MTRANCLYWSSPRTRDNHTYCRAFVIGAITICFNDLGLSRPWIETRTSACEANALPLSQYGGFNSILKHWLNIYSFTQLSLFYNHTNWDWLSTKTLPWFKHCCVSFPRCYFTCILISQEPVDFEMKTVLSVLKETQLKFKTSMSERMLFLWCLGHLSHSGYCRRATFVVR